MSDLAKVKNHNYPRLQKEEPLPALPPDIEIAQNAQLQPIEDIGAAIGLEKADREMYGSSKAKIGQSVWNRVKDRPDGKLILITAMTATSAGEMPLMRDAWPSEAGRTPASFSRASARSSGMAL